MMERRVRQLVAEYVPQCEQEQRDKAQMLAFFHRETGWLTRENTLAHVTASGWILDPAGKRALMVYHNIYRSWAWTGGHADGETDLCAVARREACEESGLTGLRALSGAPISLEILTVNGHEKRGEYVPSHLHLNVTYLFEADDGLPLRVKPDENSGARWFAPAEAIAACTEPWMARRIYEKLNRRLTEYTK